MENRVASDHLTATEVSVAQNNELLVRLLAQGRDWRLPLRNGFLAGMGGVLGATVLITVLLSVLKPFESVAPWLERVTRAIESPRR